ncbi:MAG: septation protein A [Planctomycetes bacterium]|nr:septation protein A [Planctomycetota bacterium]
MTDQAAPPASAEAPRPGKALLKFLLEFGPLVLFFVLNKLNTVPADEAAGVPGHSGIVVATKWFLVAAVVAFPLAWWVERKLPAMLALGTVAIGVFGGLTWWLDDDFFIKIKPTVFSAGLALVLLGGLACGRLFLVDLFGASLRLTEEGWRRFTVRYALFFLVVAALNEAVWRTCSDDTWVSFKVFGILPLTFVFILFQVGLMKRYALPEEGGEARGDG